MSLWPIKTHKRISKTLKQVLKASSPLTRQLKIIVSSCHSFNNILICLERLWFNPFTIPYSVKWIDILYASQAMNQTSMKNNWSGWCLLNLYSLWSRTIEPNYFLHQSFWRNTFRLLGVASGTKSMYYTFCWGLSSRLYTYIYTLITCNCHTIIISTHMHHWHHHHQQYHHRPLPWPLSPPDKPVPSQQQYKQAKHLVLYGAPPSLWCEGFCICCPRVKEEVSSQNKTAKSEIQNQSSARDILHMLVSLVQSTHQSPKLNHDPTGIIEEPRRMRGLDVLRLEIGLAGWPIWLSNFRLLQPSQNPDPLPQHEMAHLPVVWWLIYCHFALIEGTTFPIKNCYRFLLWY